MKIPILILSLSLVAGLPVPAEMSDAEGRGLLSGIFYCEASNDNFFQDAEDDDTPLSFEEKFKGFLERSSWTRQHTMEQLGVIATNLCQDASMVTNREKRAAYDNALAYLGKYGGTNALPVLDYVIDNCTSNVGLSVFRAYVDAAGDTQNAFTYYTGKIVGTNSLSSAKVGDFYIAVVSPVDLHGCTAIVSNRLHRLMYAVMEENRKLQYTVDKDLCAYWPGYARSENRRRQVARILASPENVWDTQSFLPIQTQLNAATNLVELSTNDFLNAGN